MKINLFADIDRMEDKRPFNNLHNYVYRDVFFNRYNRIEFLNTGIN